MSDAQRDERDDSPGESVKLELYKLAVEMAVGTAGPSWCECSLPALRWIAEEELVYDVATNTMHRPGCDRLAASQVPYKRCGRRVIGAGLGAPTLRVAAGRDAGSRRGALLC